MNAYEVNIGDLVEYKVYNKTTYGLVKKRTYWSYENCSVIMYTIKNLNTNKKSAVKAGNIVRKHKEITIKGVTYIATNTIG